ncbi:MAG: glycoside hydrolase family 43 protein [Tannerella sp.]|jgi:alpha-N-arabinofuranosidase|nr:glycoside hydrolase family 43 protein [Tannerella sp.]
MTNKLLICLLTGVAGVTCSLALLGCNSQSKENPEQIPLNRRESVAIFDYFNYKGEDDYYKNNPLSESGVFYNPILPGWYSDPSICTNGEDYFLVTSTFVYYPGVPIFHSKDLINWKQIGHVLDRQSQLNNFEGQNTSGGIFAPAISYNPHNQTYYMITTNVGAGNFFVKTQNPFDSWSEPIYLPEVRGIDPSFFFDDDGKAYIVNNDDPDGSILYNGHRAIRIREFDVNTDKVIGESKMIVNGGVNLKDNPIWIEGPHLYKINGKYLLMAAEGGTGQNHSEVIFSADSPAGKYTPWKNNPILTQRHLDSNRANPITCVGHADLVQAKEGDWWAVFLACRPINGTFENLGRETFLMPVKWSDDGFPYMTQDDELVPMLLNRAGAVREAETTFGNFEKNEDFNSGQLDMEWLTLRASASNLYSLTDNPGFLSLQCADITSSEKHTPAFICRRLQHHSFECTTKMFFDPSDENEAAGILIYKDETHQYFLSVRKSGSKREISLERIGASNAGIPAGQHVADDGKPVYLKVVSTGPTFECYYAEKKDEWKLLCENIDARYLSTANAGGFTGTTIGMYATVNR